jgi:phospholipid N-methyltransferase
MIRDIKTFNIFNTFTKKNEIATYNNIIHDKMIIYGLKELDLNKKLNILEIGAGNGISTKNFINQLNKLNINYEYTINEYYDEYYNDLLKISLDNNKYPIIKMMSFEDLPDNKYDLILLTCLSQINKTNIQKINSLCHKDSIIMTIGPFYYYIYCQKYFYYKQYYASLLLHIYKCKIKL